MADSTTATAAAVKSPLRRHNSISAITPTKPPIRTSSLDLELLLLKSPSFTSYTSLRDMLPSPRAVNSPTASSATMNSGYEISIRNRLVKQAARSYLQPMSSTVGNSSAPNFLRRLWYRLSSANHLTDCFRSMVSGFTQILYRILHGFSGQVRT